MTQATAAAAYGSRVFLNVPFDLKYQPIFRALVFAIHDCGLQARCALELDDGSQARVEKIYMLIKESRLGIHDISRTQLDRETRLPRFNMPLELGMFLGAKKFGELPNGTKAILILDTDRYRYHKFCSDISGQDIRAHDNDATKAIGAVRNWLQATPGVPRVDMPGSNVIVKRYALFLKELPILCRRRGLDRAHLTFIDFQTLVVGWLEANPDWRPTRSSGGTARASRRAA